MLDPIRNRLIAAFLVVVLVVCMGSGLYGNWMTSQVINKRASASKLVDFEPEQSWGGPADLNTGSRLQDDYPDLHTEPQSDFLASVWSFRMVTILIIPLLVAITIAVILARRLTAPLQTLAESARRLSEGALEQPVPLVGRGEIRALGESLETMRQELLTSRSVVETWTTLLSKRVEQRTQELAALFEVSTEISSQLELERVLNLVVDKAHTLLGGDIVVLCLLDEAGQRLTMAAASGSSEALTGCYQAVNCGIGAYVVGTGQTAHGCPKNCDCRLLCPNFRRDYVTAPLRVGDRIIGALCINDRQANRFSDDDVRLLTLLANAAAVAVDNARLYEQAEQVAAMAERERLAADIHDGLAQTLGFFNIKVAQIKELVEKCEQAQAQKELERMSEVIADTYNQVRDLIVGLHQPATSGTLAGHLAEQTAAFEREDGLPIRFTRIGEDEPEVILSSAATDEVMRIVGEAITNARKHAHADQIQVALQRDLSKRAVIVTVEDDGRGFDAQNAPSEEQGHFGLGLMRARAERGGGDLQIDSWPGQGTRVTLHWPLDEF